MLQFVGLLHADSCMLQSIGLLQSGSTAGMQKSMTSEASNRLLIYKPVHEFTQMLHPQLVHKAR